jgi:hypothetical protein
MGKYVKLFETRAYVGWEESDTGLIIQIGVGSGLLAVLIFFFILRGERYPVVKSIILSVSHF